MSQELSPELLKVLEKMLSGGRSPASDDVPSIESVLSGSQSIAIPQSSVQSYSSMPVEKYTPSARFKQPSQVVNPPQPEIKYQPEQPSTESALKEILMNQGLRRSMVSAPVSRQAKVEEPAPEYESKNKSAIEKISSQDFSAPQGESSEAPSFMSKGSLSPKNKELLMSMDEKKPMAVEDVVDFQNSQKEKQPRDTVELPEYTTEEYMPAVKSHDMTPSDIAAAAARYNTNEDGSQTAKPSLVEQLTEQLMSQLGDNKDTSNLIKNKAMEAMYAPSEYNLSPAFNMISRLHGTGEKFGQGYVSPASSEEQRASTVKLLQAAQQSGQGISKDQESLLKMYLQGDTSLQGMMMKMEMAKLANETKLKGQALADAQKAAALAETAKRNDLYGKNVDSLIDHRKGMLNKANKSLDLAMANLGIRKDNLTLRQLSAIQRSTQTKEVQQYLQQAKSLYAGIKVADTIGVITVNHLNELQQLVAQNMIRSSQSGVAERKERYIKTGNQDLLSLKQYIKSKPEGVGKDDPVFKHIIEMAKREHDIAMTNYDEAIQNNLAVYKPMIDSNPQVKAGADNMVSTRRENIGVDKNKDKKTPPPGLTKEQFLEWKRNNP